MAGGKDPESVQQSLEFMFVIRSDSGDLVPLTHILENDMYQRVRNRMRKFYFIRIRMVDWYYSSRYTMNPAAPEGTPPRRIGD